MPHSSYKQDQVLSIDSSVRRNGRLSTSLTKRPNHQPVTGVSRSSISNDRSLDIGGAAEVDRSGLTLEGATAFNLAIQQQLTHMLQSKVFAQSDKLSRFLRFIVEHVISGNQSCLKEYVIGSEVYDRQPPYHPSQDSIVRTEARRLRSKLKEYYEVEGREDPIYVYLLPGSYVPVFHAREDLIGDQRQPEPEELFLEASSVVRVVVFQFKDISENRVSSTYARGISDELAYVLMLKDRCTVISQSTTAFGSPQGPGTLSAISKAGARIAYEGTVRSEGTHLRVTARIVDAAGFQLWVKRIDVEVMSEPSFAIEEEIAVALSAGIDDLLGQYPPRNVTASDNTNPEEDNSPGLA